MSDVSNGKNRPLSLVVLLPLLRTFWKSRIKMFLRGKSIERFTFNFFHQFASISTSKLDVTYVRKRVIYFLKKKHFCN